MALGKCITQRSETQAPVEQRRPSEKQGQFQTISIGEPIVRTQHNLDLDLETIAMTRRVANSG